MPYFPELTGARYLDGHRVELVFDDGTRGVVDLGPAVRARAGQGGLFQQLLDPAYFALLEISPDWNTLTWPNGADLAPRWLYDHARGGARP